MNPVMAVLAPFSVAFILPLFCLFIGRNPGRLLAVSVFICSALSLLIAASGWQGVSVSMGGWSPDFGIVLVCDRLSGVFLFLAALGFPASFGASADCFGFSPWRFYVLFFLLWGAVNGVILAGDLFNLFVFFEILSVGACLLVSYPPRSWQAVEASFKYLVFGTVGAMFFLLGISYVFISTGNLNMALLAGLLPSVPPATMSVICGCLSVGLLSKMGAAPIHFWLPDAHSSAKTPVSALLSGVMLKASVCALIRISFLLLSSYEGEGIFRLLSLFGVISVVVGHLMAFKQDDIKRLLAYSTVAQIGAILIGIGSGSGLGVSGALYHSLVHMAAKTGLFVSAGILTDRCGSRNIDEMGGVWRRDPAQVVLFAFFALSLSGIPPFCGFTSKWFLMAASSGAGSLLPALALVAGTVISSCYYLRVLRSLCSEPYKSPIATGPRHVSAVVLGFLAVMCVALAFLPVFPWARDVLFSSGNAAVDVELYRSLVLDR